MKTRLLLHVGVGLICGTVNSMASNYSINVPSGLSLIANQFKNGANSLDIVLPNVPDQSVVYKWNCSGYVAYTYDASIGGWFPTGGTLAPGEGAFISNPGPAFTLTFNGTHITPILPATLPCGCDQLNLLSRQTDGTGTYENVTGRVPLEGAQVYRWNVASQSYVIHTYSGGAWSPSIPTLAIGEGAFFYVPCQAKAVQIPDASTNGLDIKATSTNILADDFQCTATGPITQIRIWGSWRSDQVPTAGTCFCLGFWSDIPKQGTNYSRPGIQLGQACFNPGQYRSFIYTNANERFLDPNGPAIIGTDTNVWEYDFTWPTNTPFFQTNGNIYWVSVSANCFNTNQFLFGWKTCPTNFNDNAVYGHVNASGVPLQDWKELRRIPGNSNGLDLAFVVITETNQPSPTENRWLQPPDTSTNGLDVRVTQPKILADDFLCTASGPISQVHVWTSWRSDQVPPTLPCICLGIWSDVPGNATTNSRPGQRLCNYCYNPGQYVFFPSTNGVFERFWDPNISGTNGFIGADSNIWEYVFEIPTNQPCMQTNGTVYWLSVSAACLDTNQFLLGWKTTPYNWNDDAVYGHVDAGGNPLLDWKPLRRPPGSSNGVDLAFVVIRDSLQSFISIERSNLNVILRWTNGWTLQSAGAVAGPYTNIPGATSPYLAPIAEPRRFFRTRMP